MKIIHCADLHLDSKMNSNFDKIKAKERKAEILHTFERMVEYAAEEGVQAVLIAGDLFDTRNISAAARNTVLFGIKDHPSIIFYYLKGNHDSDNFLSGLEEIPDNLKLFDSQWTSYRQEGVVISGMELTQENAGSAYVSLVLNARDFNIVMLHGQESDSSYKDKTLSIPLKALKNKGIDYLALGHIHGYKKGVLDARGTYCYPGCLEGRGFDECGSHGFVMIDIDPSSGKYTHQFIPFARRSLYTVTADVTGCDTTAMMASRVALELQKAGCGSESLVKIVLTGALDVECEKDVDYLLTRFGSQFYYVKVYDETHLKIETENYLFDKSLKGEFARLVMEDGSISEEDKKIIIRYGFQAIAGEEVQ